MMARSTVVAMKLYILHRRRKGHLTFSWDSSCHSLLSSIPKLKHIRIYIGNRKLTANETPNCNFSEVIVQNRIRLYSCVVD